MLRFLSCAAISVVLLASAPQVEAQDLAPVTPPPPVATCAHPEVAAATLHAVEPESPPQLKRYGIGGRVVVNVTLDMGSRVVAAYATRWSSRFLVPSAQAAARASTFSTAIHNCVPTFATYQFIVLYNAPKPAPALHVDPLGFFPGTWRCTAADGAPRTLIFAPDGAGLNENDGTSTVTAAPDAYGVWRVHGDNAVIGWAYPWTDDTWQWRSPNMLYDRTTFERIDAATFTLTTSVGSAVSHIDRSERCARLAAAAS